jgi:hypothetical protein
MDDRDRPGQRQGVDCGFPSPSARDMDSTSQFDCVHRILKLITALTPRYCSLLTPPTIDPFFEFNCSHDHSIDFK